MECVETTYVEIELALFPGINNIFLREKKCYLEQSSYYDEGHPHEQ